MSRIKTVGKNGQISLGKTFGTGAFADAEATGCRYAGYGQYPERLGVVTGLRDVANLTTRATTRRWTAHHLGLR